MSMPPDALRAELRVDKVDVTVGKIFSYNMPNAGRDGVWHGWGRVGCQLRMGRSSQPYWLRAC
jgi:hypothetical protein